MCIFSAWHQQHPLKLRCNSIVIFTDRHCLSCSRQVFSSYDPHRTFTATELTEATRTSEFGVIQYFNYMYSFLVCACLTLFAYVHECFMPCGLCKCFCFRKMSLHLCLCLWIWYKNRPCFRRFFLCFLPLWWRFALNALIHPLCSFILFRIWKLFCHVGCNWIDCNAYS